jgi:hypothetical protein
VSRALTIELRRGVGPFAAPLLLGVLIAGLLAHQRDWAGDWTGSSYYLRFLVLIGGPVLVAAAAWQGGRSRRRGLDELLGTSSRSRLRQTLMAWSSPAAWGVAAYLLTVLAAAAVTAANTSYGRPLLGMLLSGGAALLALAAFAYGIGVVAPWRLTAPALALVTYVGLGYLDITDSAARWLSPAIEPSSLAFQLPASWWAPTSTMLFLGLTAATLLTVGQRWLAASLALLVAVAAAVPIVRVGAAAFTDDRAAAQLVCAPGAGTQVCLTRRHADQLPVVQRLAGEVLAGLPSPPRVVEGYSRQDNATDIRLNELYLGPTVLGGPDERVVRDDLANGVTAWGCDPLQEPAPDDVVQQSYALAAWLLNRRTTDGQTEPQMLAITAAFSAAAKRCDGPAARAATAALR